MGSPNNGPYCELQAVYRGAAVVSACQPRASSSKRSTPAAFEQVRAIPEQAPDRQRSIAHEPRFPRNDVPDLR
jgi:hypothetical protein